jgi:uncharacterized protein (TIGR02452 family)
MKDRSWLRRIAAETIAISNSGHYQTADTGSAVNIADAVAASIKGTRRFCLNSLDRVDEAHAGVVCGVAGDSDGRSYIAVEALTTLDAAQRLYRETGRIPTVLNFASAKRPGGGFRNGAMAQEEDIAYRSTLYASLAAQPQYYADSLNELRRGIYFDQALYTPGMIVIRDGAYALAKPWHCHCVTAPAPNCKAALKNGASEVDVEASMARRIRLVLGVMSATGATDLVLGAYGCGVFGNLPKTVARLFAEELGIQSPCREQWGGLGFKTVVFAIPNPSSCNHQAFSAAFAHLNSI